MPVRDFFGVLRRRWLLVLVGLLVTVGLSGAAYQFFKPTYEATGTVLLLPPASSLVKGSTNPYLQLSGLAQAVDLVGVALSDQATQLEMKAISKDVEYTVKADVNTSSPLLVIDVKDSSPEDATRIRDVLVERVPIRLDDLQKSLGVSANDRVTSAVLTLDAQAEEVGRNRLRAALVAACVGVALTLVVATLWDARRRRHPRRRSSGRGSRGIHEGAVLASAAAVDTDEEPAGTSTSRVISSNLEGELEEPTDATDNATS